MLPGTWAKNLAELLTTKRKDLNGGEAGIRTLGGDQPSTVFKTAAFGRSATSPHPENYIGCYIYCNLNCSI